jgi:hypothetical protein
MLWFSKWYPSSFPTELCSSHVHLTISLYVLCLSPSSSHFALLLLLETSFCQCIVEILCRNATLCVSLCNRCHKSSQHKNPKGCGNKFGFVELFLSFKCWSVLNVFRSCCKMSVLVLSDNTSPLINQSILTYYHSFINTGFTTCGLSSSDA